MALTTAPVRALFAFISEREMIWHRRFLNKTPKPWTKDPILQSYRFCNTRRERDATTIWIAKNWRDPNQDEKYLWFAMLIARLLNNPATLEEIGFPSMGNHYGWKPKEFIAKLDARAARGERLFGPAYMISTHGASGSKTKYITYTILANVWEKRKELKLTNNNPLADLHTWLSSFHGLGSFMAAQVVADVKYAYPWNQALDWHHFVASGPGSRRGLNRVLGRDVDNPWKEDDWVAHLGSLWDELFPLFAKAGVPVLHYQDLQNCLCEFDKYERVRLGQGRPKQRYNGGA